MKTALSSISPVFGSSMVSSMSANLTNTFPWETLHNIVSKPNVLFLWVQIYIPPSFDHCQMMDMRKSIRWIHVNDSCGDWHDHHFMIILSSSDQIIRWWSMCQWPQIIIIWLYPWSSDDHGQTRTCQWLRQWRWFAFLPPPLSHPSPVLGHLISFVINPSNIEYH